MYNYSPIKALYIKNFRNLGEVTIDFKDSPIVCLVGENEAGKTSVVKAFGVCAHHVSPRDQKDYIRDGTSMFGVAIELEDGTLIKRVKSNRANMYNVTRPDGTVWESTTLSEGLPAEVDRLMGLIEEPETKELLHIRTYEDKLLFVVTPASTNYKVMYEALKVSQLTQAIKRGSDEANSLKSKISNNEVSIQSFTNMLKGVKVYDTSILLRVRDRLQEQMSVLEKLNRGIEVLEKLESVKRNLGALGKVLTGEVKPVDTELALRLQKVNSLLSEIDRSKRMLNCIEKVESLENIDAGCISKLDSAITRKYDLERKKRESQSLIQIASAKEVPELLISNLERAREVSKRLSCLTTAVSRVNTTGCEPVEQSDLDILNKLSRAIHMLKSGGEQRGRLDKINDSIEEIMGYLKDSGVAVATCPRCGESVVVDRDLEETWERI